jgi:predicted HTH transcriptional regulator
MDHDNVPANFEKLRDILAAALLLGDDISEHLIAAHISCALELTLDRINARSA